MTEFEYEMLREMKGFALLKVGDILRWQGRRDLIIEECSSYKYPLIALRRVGDLGNKVYFQIVNYRIESVFKDDLISYFGPTIRETNQELYTKAELKMNRAGITNQTEAHTLEADRRMARASENLLKIIGI